jgi:hypothetical protein
MKNIITYFIILLMFGFSTVFAQTTSTLEEPRLSPEEQAILLSAGEDNPARIDEAAMTDAKIDPREMATEDDFGPANAKPDESQALDPKIEAEDNKTKQEISSAPVTPPVATGAQPAGEKIGTITDYRNTQGIGKEQPQGETPARITNYNEIQGPVEQPAGDIPVK